MKPYILLTPGPLTTSETVKEAMLTDWCTYRRGNTQIPRCTRYKANR